MAQPKNKNLWKIIKKWIVRLFKKSKVVKKENDPSFEFIGEYEPTEPERPDLRDIQKYIDVYVRSKSNNQF